MKHDLTENEKGTTEMLERLKKNEMQEHD